MKRAALPGLLLSLFLAGVPGPVWSAEAGSGPAPEKTPAACKPIEAPEAVRAGHLVTLRQLQPGNADVEALAKALKEN